MMIRRFVCFLSVLAVIGVGLVFGSGGAQLAPAGQEKMTVTLGWAAPPPEKVDQALEKYLEERFNFEFKIVAFDNAQFDQQLSVMIAGGEIPDIIRHNFQTMVQYYEKGIIRELPMALLEKNMPNFVKWTNELDPSLWDVTKYKGKQVGLTHPSPLGSWTYPIIWRSDMLQAAGVSKAPETLEEWESTLKKIKAAKGVAPLSAAGPAGGGNMQIGNWFGPIFGAYGTFPGQWQKKAGKLVYFFEDPGYIEAVKLLARWYADGLIDPEWVTTVASDRAGTTEDLFVRFAKGSLAVLYNNPHTEYRPWDWYNNEIQSLVGSEGSARWQGYNKDWEKTKSFGGVWTVGKPPVGPKGASGNVKGTAAVSAIMISAKADDARVARLLNYLEVMGTDPEAYLANFGGPASIRDKILTESPMPDSPTGKTYIWNRYTLDMDGGKLPKDDNYYKVWGSGYFSPWIHWSPKIKFIWAGEVLKDRVKLAEQISNVPGYLNAFVLPLPSQKNYADLDRVVAEYTMKAITGAYKDLGGEYAKALASWKKNGGEVLSKEANELYGN